MNILRILVVHSAYQQRGGEESVMESEVELLRAHGHEVQIYRRDNREIDLAAKMSVAIQAFWSHMTTVDFKRLATDFRPDLLHVHNTFPLVSPSLYWAAARANVPVVQTLHNFRLLCPQAMLLRNRAVCEDCLGKLPWRGIVHRCYRHSLSQSAVLAGTLSLHRMIGTYSHKVSRYIALNEFCRNKFVEGGLPADRVVTKPHFVDIPAAPGERRAGGLYVGRIAPEKGISVLVGALEHPEGSDITVIGTGPDETLLRSSKARLLGYFKAPHVYEHMRRASYLVMPSIVYENLPRTLIEAFACSLPVIASRLGPMAEVVEDGKTGLLFDPGSAEDLAAKMRWADQHPEQMSHMGQNARVEYEMKYTPDINYERLMQIYAQAMAHGEFPSNQPQAPGRPGREADGK